ncbi:MAG: triose-phosphate isomerase [Verrucomicrobia bacterium]|nr:triose-phosphate isomerase [Verrucomicrobiota bacterium]
MNKIIVGNWKMHKTIEESTLFLKALIPLVSKAKAKVMIAPPFTSLSECSKAVKGTNVLIGGQNMGDAEEGAYTGEISGRMLKEAGASFVILGHSERRTIFGETDELINRKVLRAQADGLIPILCIGETQEQREKGHSLAVLKKQLDGCLKGFSSGDLIIAYEPVWAIGTGKTATPEMAQEMHMAIRKHLGQRLPILYGGSVKPANIDSLLIQPDIDGALIGGASLDVEPFAKMVVR